MGYQISDEEDSKLFDEPHIVRIMYFGLRRNMDFQTGIVGYKKRINEAFFYELLSVPSIRGRKGYFPSRKEIRNCIERLHNIGLIEPLDHYVFKLKFATRDQSDQNIRGRTRARLAAKNNSTKELNNKEIIDELMLLGANDFLIRGQPPVSGNITSSNLIHMSSLPMDESIVNDTFDQGFDPIDAVDPKIDPVDATKRKIKKENLKFNDFWLLYPKRVAKKKASDLWLRHKLWEKWELIESDLKTRIWNPDPQYIPHPTTYLNRESWADEFKGAESDEQKRRREINEMIKRRGG